MTTEPLKIWTLFLNDNIVCASPDPSLANAIEQFLFQVWDYLPPLEPHGRPMIKGGSLELINPNMPYLYYMVPVPFNAKMFDGGPLEPDFDNSKTYSTKITRTLGEAMEEAGRVIRENLEDNS
jgi:hypothetical protein